ncbi:hypothetical protein Hanom_Chr17g01555811 [Helianthus anomalus]
MPCSCSFGSVRLHFAALVEVISNYASKNGSIPDNDLRNITTTNTAQEIPNADHGNKYVCIIVPQRLAHLTQIVNHSQTRARTK